MCKEIVICAAVRAKDGLIVRGNRHHDAIRALHLIPGYSEEVASGDNQGFMTSYNRYVTRKEGYLLQIAAGIESADSTGYRGGQILFSEDLY